ncbi:MAG: hypothetical protein ABSE70_11315 [Candidatus Limnocylindrales bacterium]
MFDRTVTPSCTVGLNGAAVSVTVQGSGAQAQCNSFLRTTTNGGNWYLYSGGQQPAGASICQIRYLGDLWTVRDNGALNVYGSGICTNLANLANGIPLATRTAAPTIKVPPNQVYAVCGLRVADHDATVLMDLDECTAFERDYPPADPCSIEPSPQG